MTGGLFRTLASWTSDLRKPLLKQFGDISDIKTGVFPVRVQDFAARNASCIVCQVAP